jgi:heptosyltransferase I
MSKKILIIKTSSMGDILHVLPALSDAKRHDPDIEFDWVIERAFQEIPHWHKAVNKVIPIAQRQWRKSPFQALRSDEFRSFIHAIRETAYDQIIDAQGLVKSAWIGLLGKGKRVGLNMKTAREPLAALFYQQHFQTDWSQHAVVRMRQLFADALGYSYASDTLDYGLDHVESFTSPYKNYIVFLHGTTWETKYWPLSYWGELAEQLSASCDHILLPWGNQKELENARKIAMYSKQVVILPRLTLSALAGILSHAKLIYAVDTGLGHLSAALGVPTISLFGATDPLLTGAYGLHQYHLSASFECSPCLKRVCQHPLYDKIIPPCYKTLPPQKAYALGLQILEKK